MDVRFDHEGISFDLEKGCGSVLDTIEIDYLGFLAYIRPSVFLQLCPPLEDGAGAVEHLVAAGAPLGMPFLNVSLRDPERKVLSHEGRHRMRGVLAHVGDLPMPVAMFLRGGDRARHVESEHLEAFASGMTSEAYEPEWKGRWISGPIFEQVRIRGEIIQLCASSMRP